MPAHPWPRPRAERERRPNPQMCVFPTSCPKIPPLKIPRTTKSGPLRNIFDILWCGWGTRGQQRAGLSQESRKHGATPHVSRSQVSACPDKACAPCSFPSTRTLGVWPGSSWVSSVSRSIAYHVYGRPVEGRRLSRHPEAGSFGNSGRTRRSSSRFASEHCSVPPARDLRNRLHHATALRWHRLLSKSPALPQVSILGPPACFLLWVLGFATSAVVNRGLPSKPHLS